MQAYTILDTKKEADENRLDFLRNEFRVANYFTVKSSMGETSHINKPEDLYYLPVDESVKAYHQKKLENYVPDENFIKWANDYLIKNQS